MSKALQRVLELPSSRGTAFALHTNDTNRLSGILDRSDSPRFTSIEINVYGRSLDAGSVGKILADSGLYLQKPYYCIDEAPYENPQLLSLPELSDEHQYSSTEIDRVLNGDDGMLTDISFVLDHLSEDISAVESEIDSHVTAKLERYDRIKSPK